jgi:HK97 family phage major capsid protein
MAASKVKELLDELAATLAELGMLDEEGVAEEAGENTDGTPVEGERSAVEAVEARQAKYDALLAKAERIKSAIAKSEAAEARKAELLKTLNRATPAHSEAAVNKPSIYPISRRGSLKAFEDYETAYKCGQWLKASGGDAEAKRWCRDAGIEVRDMGEQVNSLGGVTVFDQFENQLIRRVEQYGVAANISQKITMTTDTVLVPRRLTGVTASWIGENTTIPTSDPTATMVQLVAKKLAVATRVSMELLNDSAMIADWLLAEFSLAIAKQQDDAVFLGDGSSTYGGIRGLAQLTDGTHAASVATAATGNTTIAALDIDDYLAAMGKIPRYAIGTSAWYMHPSVYHNSVQRMMLSSGTAGSGTIGALAGGNTAQNLANSTPTTFLGLPVVWVLSMNSAPTTGQTYAYVGDVSLAAIMGEKAGGVQIASSDDRYFEYDQRVYKCSVRMDWNLHTAGDATTAGPVIACKLA